ncbi:MAG: hypothetical protein IJL92_05975 [Thermoguttaceae bacterium]|nr:hypothetical protein [Thermoguttaceae bacterium]
MEIDNLTRYMAYASYACVLAKEKALTLKQEALANGGSVGNHTAEGLELDVYYYDKMRLVFSFAAEQLAQRQETNGVSDFDCEMICYWFSEPLLPILNDVDYFETGIFVDAADQYQRRHYEKERRLCEEHYYEERGVTVVFSKSIVKRYSKPYDLKALVNVARGCCDLAIEKASGLIQKNSVENGDSIDDGEIRRLENEIRLYRELQNAFSLIVKQLGKKRKTTKESYDKCSEIERVFKDCLSDVQYFKTDIFLLAAEEYKRRYDKERLAENSFPEKKTRCFSDLFHFLQRRGTS